MAKSWSWSQLLTKAVNHQGRVDIPTPDYDEALVDPSTVELAVGNDVVDVPDDATVTFNGETATVVNKTGDAWAAGETVYLYVKAKGVDDITGNTLAEMQVQIDANTAEIETHTAAIADLDSRVAAIESAASAARAVPLAAPQAKGE